MADYPHAHAESINTLTSDRVAAKTIPLQTIIVLPLEDVHPEALALMTGLHPAHFDTEGHKLVRDIIEGNNARIPMKPAARPWDM